MHALQNLLLLCETCRLKGQRGAFSQRMKGENEWAKETPPVAHVKIDFMCLNTGTKSTVAWLW